MQGTSPGESSLLDALLDVYLGGHEDFSKVMYSILICLVHTLHGLSHIIM